MSGPKCPICNKASEDRKLAPFCSKRCADIDLSRWLKGSYAIPGASLDEAENAPSYSKSRDHEGS